MRPALSPLHTPIDVGLGGVLLANMLVAWLDGNPTILPTGEATDESQDPGTMLLEIEWSKDQSPKSIRWLRET
jgi:hypothetical protein